MIVTIVDPKCPTPYDEEVLATRGLGGTEATVVRVASGLSGGGIAVRVVQHNRRSVHSPSPSLIYLPGDLAQDAVADANHVIFIQKAQDLKRLAATCRARLWVWLHNYAGDEVPVFWQDHLRYRLGLICVSATHAEHTRRHIRQQLPNYLSMGALSRRTIAYIYNPLTKSLPAKTGEPDPYKLAFFSSPYKGLEQVLDHFSHVHRLQPRFRLYVADPGYVRNFNMGRLDIPGVVTLGSLPQRDALRHVQESLCVFYPQRKRPETFGLVYAEANAVGTPVLAHDHGSAREILVDANPPFDTSDPAAVNDVLCKWLEGERPVVSADPRFEHTAVISQWRLFLDAPEAVAKSQADDSERRQIAGH